MPLEKFIPLSPDPNITTSSDMGMAQFGHLNTIVDYLNGTNDIPGDGNPHSVIGAFCGISKPIRTYTWRNLLFRGKNI